MDTTEIFLITGINEEEYDRVWTEWRKVIASGIWSNSDDIIRQLHSEFSYFASLLGIGLGKLQVKANKAEFLMENTLAYLIAVEYPDGAVNQRTLSAKSNMKYVNAASDYNDAQAMVMLCKSITNACEKAMDALSRDISYRIKQGGSR